MREIKFRAWDKKLKKFRFFHLFHSHTIITDLPIPSKGEWEHLERFEQFAGFKDKRDNEIYEGDIIELSPLRKTDPTVYAIIGFEDGCFDMFGINKRPNKDTGIRFVRELYIECISKHVEVIGNIYENPELLESKKIIKCNGCLKEKEEYVSGLCKECALLMDKHIEGNK